MKKKSSKKLTNAIFIILIISLIVIVVKMVTKDDKKENNESKKIEEKIEVAEEKKEEQTKEEENKDNTSTKQEKIKEERLAEGKVLSGDGLPVLMYHFFYDKEKGETGQDDNWLEISQFEEQIKYLSDNDFYYPTWNEVEEYIDGKIKLPEKSVVITVDDGDPSFFELGVPIIQKYDAIATSFVVVYWYGDVINDKQKNISYQSHSYDMHKAGSNGKGVLLSWSYEKIKEDLELSSKLLDGANIFCYPFGQYIESNFKVLKDSGYKLAFTTQGGRVKVGSSKYELPRVRISSKTGINAFIKKVE